jgi:hypothetical protein
MKLHSFTSLTTNSSSMVYVIMDEQMERAKELAEKYNFIIHDINALEAFIQRHPHTGSIFDDNIDNWDNYEPPWPRESNDPDKFQEYNKKYREAAQTYAKYCISVIKDKNIKWFSPNKEDNDMSETEADDYCSISSGYTRLS